MDMRLSFTWHSKIFFFQEFSDWEKLMVRVDLKRLMWQDSTHLYLYISSLNLSPSLPSSLQYQYLVRQDQTLSDFRLKYCSMVQTKSVFLSKKSFPFNLSSHWKPQRDQLRLILRRILYEVWSWALVQHCCFGCWWSFEDLHCKIDFNTFVGF